jgi:hypothetical protein
MNQRLTISMYLGSGDAKILTDLKSENISACSLIP